MNNTESEGIIHEVHFDRDELCLRLDTYGLRMETDAPQPILTARLIGCIDVAETVHILQEAIGKYFYLWSTETPDGRTKVVVEVDHRIAELEIDCASVTQDYFNYTEEDLRRKCQWLSIACHSSQDECLAVNRKWSHLSSGLKKIINQERERCERKLQFFRQVNPERTAEMQGQLVAYERVLARMAQLIKPDSGAVLYNNDVSR